MGPERTGRPGGSTIRGRAQGGSANARMVLQRSIGRRGPRYLRSPENALARSHRLQGQVNKGDRRRDGALLFAVIVAVVALLINGIIIGELLPI